MRLKHYYWQSTLFFPVYSARKPIRVNNNITTARWQNLVPKENTQKHLIILLRMEACGVYAPGSQLLIQWSWEIQNDQGKAQSGRRGESDLGPEE